MKPLTIEEIKQLKEYDYFWLVNINDTNKNIYISNISYTKETLAGLDFYNNFRRMKWDNYGKTWVAYKNKEQAECDITQTNFTVADVIIWKKKTALPNSCSPNKLTRIVEFVYVFCRKNEIKTFYSNKSITSYRKTGQAAYENIYNFIEAANNDGVCPYNKATFSSELCEKLLKIYAPKNGIIYDPFIGSGTTAVACKKMELNYIASEISENQVQWAEKRLQELF